MSAGRSAADAIATSHNPDAGRYEIRVADELAGITEYRDRAGRRIFVHTEVDPARSGMGLATRLIRDALDDTRATGLRIVARCPFVRAFVERHREYLEPPPAETPADREPPR